MKYQVLVLRKRKWLVWLLLGVIALVAGYIALDRWQRDLIFSVQTGSRTWWREPLPNTEILDLPLDNGEHIRAWYWQHPDPQASTVLYLLGARWNLNGSAFRFEQLTRLGLSVLAIDYRGFGASSPRLPSEQSAREDAWLAMKELIRRQPHAERRFIYGHSLGGAIAIDLATRLDESQFAGLIAESTFTRIEDMLALQPWGDIPGLRWLITQSFDSESDVAQLTRPLLLIHGTADRTVPHEMSDVLYEAAALVPKPPSGLLKIEGASHSGSGRAGTVYSEPVQAFLKMAGTLAATQQQALLQRQAVPAVR